MLCLPKCFFCRSREPNSFRSTLFWLGVESLHSPSVRAFFFVLCNPYFCMLSLNSSSLLVWHVLRDYAWSLVLILQPICLFHLSRFNISSVSTSIYSWVGSLFSWISYSSPLDPSPSFIACRSWLWVVYAKIERPMEFRLLVLYVSLLP